MIKHQNDTGFYLYDYAFNGVTEAVCPHCGSNDTLGMESRIMGNVLGCRWCESVTMLDYRYWNDGHREEGSDDSHIPEMRWDD